MHDQLNDHGNLINVTVDVFRIELKITILSLIYKLPYIQNKNFQAFKYRIDQIYQYNKIDTLSLSVPQYIFLLSCVSLLPRSLCPLSHI